MTKRNHLVSRASSTNPDFYQNILLDTLSTYDSLYVSNLHNELAFTFDIGNSGSKLNFLYANELIDYNLQGNKNQFFINQVAADLVFNIYSFKVAPQFTYKYEEILKSGYFFNIHFEKEAKGFIDRVFINSLSKSDYPSLIADSYTSNHFIWRSEFKNVKQNKVSAGLFLKDEIAGLSVSGLNIGDYIYYDVNVLPVQYNDVIKMISVDLTIKYNFYKNWTFYNESSFQSADKNKIYPVPDLTAYSCIYYERDYFKKALMASIGIGCNYFTSYYANAFMPATSQFYLQQEHKIGNYPYFDFFANIRVRTAKFFIRVEHFNKGLSDDNYFYLPLQPTPGRTLKLGLNWNFSEVLYK